MRGDYLFLAMAISTLSEPKRSIDDLAELRNSSVTVVSINYRNCASNGISDNFEKAGATQRKFYLPYQRRG